MKNILILIFALLSIQAFAQFNRDNYPADTLSVINRGDTALYVQIGYKSKGVFETFPELDKDGIDSNTVARFAFRFIQENEAAIANAHRTVLKQRKLTKGYPQANTIINNYSGKNAIDYAWGEYQSRFAGYWKADSANVERFLLVSAEIDTIRNLAARYVIRINAQGNQVGQVLGKFAGVTFDSFQTSIYPTAGIGVNRPRWVALDQGGRTFFSLDSAWRWVWLGRTLEEAQQFIQSLNGG